MPKNIRLNSTHYFIIKIPNKQELYQDASNHSSDTDFKNFMNLYKKCTAKPYSFLAIHATFASEYLTGEEILVSNQSQIIEQAKFAYSPLRKAFENQTKKHVDAIKSLDLSNKKDQLKQRVYFNKT